MPGRQEGVFVAKLASLFAVLAVIVPGPFGPLSDGHDVD